MQIYNNIGWLTPEIFLSFGILTLFTYSIFFPHKSGIYTYNNFITRISIILLILNIILLIYNYNYIGNNTYIFEDLLRVNKLIYLSKLIVTIGTMIILIIGPSINDRFKQYEISMLFVLALLGMDIIISTSDIMILYLGIELLSLTLYILASIKRNGEFSTEAGLKYFIMGAVSSGIFLIGAVMLYSLTGHTSYIAIENLLLYETNITHSLGAILIIISLLFKLAAAPFHMWAPDVYEGSPTIITTFFATVPKISIFIGLFVLITGPFMGIYVQLQPLIIISIIFSLIVGSLGAINQNKLKRLLAYSAIGHMGFILIGLIIGSINSIIATIIYYILYIVMSIISFTVILIQKNWGDSPNIFNLIGLSRINPVLAITFALCLLSIAGVPPLAGFLSKYLILISAVENQMYLVTFIAITTSVISGFYYLQLIKIMFFKDSNHYNLKWLADITYSNIYNIKLHTGLILGVSLYIIITTLIYPTPLLLIINESIVSTLI